MPATHLTGRLVRFDEVRELPGAEGSPVADPVRTIVGADNGAAGSPPGSATAADDRPAPDGPFAVITTAGWDFAAPDFDVARALDFGAGVAEVHAAMADVDGMHSQQSFTTAGLALDGFTFTFWRDDSAMRAFAYRRPSPACVSSIAPAPGAGPTRWPGELTAPGPSGASGR